MENLESIFEKIRKDYTDGVELSQDRFDEMKKVFDEKIKANEKKDIILMIEDFFKEDLESNIDDERAKIKKYFGVSDGKEFSDLKDKVRIFMLPYDRKSFDDNKVVAVYAAVTNDSYGFYRSLLSCSLIMYDKYLREKDNEKLVEAMLSLTAVINTCRNNGIDDGTINECFNYFLKSNSKKSDIVKPQNILKGEIKDDIKVDNSKSGSINSDDSLDDVLDKISDSLDDEIDIKDDEAVKESAPFKKPIKVKVVKTVVKKSKSGDKKVSANSGGKTVEVKAVHKDSKSDLVDDSSLNIPVFDIDLDKSFDDALNDVLKDRDKLDKEKNSSKKENSKKSDFVVKIDNYFEDISEKDNSKKNNSKDDSLKINNSKKDDSKIEWSGSIWGNDDISLNNDRNVRTEFEYLNDGRTADDLVNQYKSVGNSFSEFSDKKKKKSIFRKVKRKTSNEEHESIKKKIIDKCIKILGLEEEYGQKRSR